jgi:hypothetical protein
MVATVEQRHGFAQVAFGGLVGPHDEQHLPDLSRQHRGGRRGQRRWRIEDHQARRVGGEQRRDQLARAPAGQQLGVGIALRPGRQKAELGNIGADDAAFHVDRRIGQCIEQTRTVAAAQPVHHIGLGDIAIDQQHLHIAFRRQRDRQVDRAIGLALIGIGRTDQDGARLIGILRADRARGNEQLALHLAEFLDQRVGHAAGHEQALFREQLAIDLHRRVGDAGTPDRRLDHAGGAVSRLRRGKRGIGRGRQVGGHDHGGIGRHIRESLSRA